jgi:ABC-2 type transport system ATP-binding protein
VLLRDVLGGAVDGAAIGLVALGLDRLPALDGVEAGLRLLRDRAFFVTARHECECTLALVAAALAVSGLVKRYGNVGALVGADLIVERGELVGLLGPKTGRADVCGARTGTRDARAALGYLAEFFRFPGWSSADELLELHQRLVSSDGGERERGELLELVGLADARRRRVEEMSKGMQQRLGIAQALVGRPQLLLLDEPTSALDPVGRRTVRTLLEELRRRGVSVLLNSHLLSEVELVCDRVAILLAGRVVAAGTPRELEKPRGVEVETEEGTVTYAQAGREDVPRLVEQLLRDGRKIYGARVLTSTLEEVYVEAVGGETE